MNYATKAERDAAMNPKVVSPKKPVRVKPSKYTGRERERRLRYLNNPGLAHWQRPDR